MAYRGGLLRDWFTPKARALNVKAVEAIAEDANAWGLDKVAAKTPVHTGNLRTSWYSLPVVFFKGADGTGFRGGWATDVKYAPYVEHGTGLYGPRRSKYEIVPKDAKALHWRDPVTGRSVFALHVWHPGSKGHYMNSTTLTLLEMEMARIARPSLERWARRLERVNKSDRGMRRR